jgi:pimeloyl-ACP methyl ester carboxylesterase/predicted glycosyltransferase
MENNPVMTTAQSRAVLPDRSGVAKRDGVRLVYEEFDRRGFGTAGTGVDPSGPAAAQPPRAGEPAVVLLPTWQIIGSQFWKAQVGYLSLHHRVVTFDGRGSGRSDKPVGAAAYANAECAADILAVLDATSTKRAVLVALSCAATWAVHAAAEHPERVAGIVAISPACGFPISNPERDQHVFDAPNPDHEGWAGYNKYNWLHGDFSAFQRFFFGRMCSEPHSDKLVEDFLEWAAHTDPAVLVDATAGRMGLDGALCPSVAEAARRVRCPVTVVHGTNDRIRPIAIGERLAELTGGSFIAVEGGGHALPAREPVLINRLIREMAAAVGSGPGTEEGVSIAFARNPVRRSTWVRAPGRPRRSGQALSDSSRARRALFLSSPIGLGHAQRDVAIAAELRRLRPDVQIEWLAQHPVTRVLEHHGMRIHPASEWLLNESKQFENDCGEHDLHAFQAIRRMDEVLVNNFMVFSDVAASEHFDLVVGDEAWDVDHFLHENPELKRFQFAWMTDFVGWLPMPDADDRERYLAADLNAEMLEHRARFTRVRDRSIFVGNPGDVVPDAFGPGLPAINDWVGQNFDFSGYVTGFDPAALGDPAVVRARWGCREGERLCVVTVGGSGVGEHLLRRVLEAVPLVRQRVPDMRFLVVAGPRIDPALLPEPDGATVVGFVPDLHRDLAACDVAIVQGGLTTCMELTAAAKPFVYVPLRHHFEQNIHVRRRLEQYGSGRCLPYEQAADPDLLAEVLIAEQAIVPAYRPVETDGARVVAGMLAELF